MHGGAGALLRRTGRADPHRPVRGVLAGTVLRPGTACVRPIGGEDGSPGGRGASPLYSCQAGAGEGAEAAGAPVPYPVKLADPPRVVISMDGRAELAAGGDTATAPSAPSLGELVRMNFAHCE